MNMLQEQADLLLGGNGIPNSDIPPAVSHDESVLQEDINRVIKKLATAKVTPNVTLAFEDFPQAISDFIMVNEWKIGDTTGVVNRTVENSGGVNISVNFDTELKTYINHMYSDSSDKRDQFRAFDRLEYAKGKIKHGENYSGMYCDVQCVQLINGKLCLRWTINKYVEPAKPIGNNNG